MTMMKFTTADCKRLLPEVLVDYLWELVAESGADSQTFVLSAKHAGTGPVQEILHRQGRMSSWHRVFGYDPVDAVIEVRLTGMGAIMSLRQSGPAGDDTYRKENATCSA